jgi:choloylglycine hydrolase
MKKLIAVFLLFSYSSSFACSTFLLSKNGKHVFGKNYDWVTGNGAIMVNARGLYTTSMAVNEKPFSWTALYGSVSFNQYGKEFPNGGMSEKGLVIELMWLEETTYPTPDSRPALGVLQWIQYQLDCAGTVDEVLKSDGRIRVSGHEGAPLHYLVADASGAAATIEFIKGKMVVHKGAGLPFPVLTNSAYKESIQRQKGAAPSNNSLLRFTSACSMLQQYHLAKEVAPVPHAFSILDKIAQGDFTKWRIVYDISDRKVFFKTDQYKAERSFSLHDFNFSCGSRPLAFDLSIQTAKTKFIPLTFNQNNALIRKSVAETGNRINASPEAITATANYFKIPLCK